MSIIVRYKGVEEIMKKYQELSDEKLLKIIGGWSWSRFWHNVKFGYHYGTPNWPF